MHEDNLVSILYIPDDLTRKGSSQEDLQMSSLLKCSRNLKQRLIKAHRVSILAFVDFLLWNICSVKYSVWLKVTGQNAISTWCQNGKLTYAYEDFGFVKKSDRKSRFCIYAESNPCTTLFYISCCMQSLQLSSPAL